MNVLSKCGKVKCSMKGNNKVKWIGYSTKQLPDILEETLAPILGESHNCSCKQGIISSWLPNQFPQPTEKKKLPPDHSQLILNRSKPLLTVSTADYSVFLLCRVCTLYPQVVLHLFT